MNLLRSGLVAMVLVIAGTTLLQAQTADEIMNKYAAAIGGDAWKKVISMKTTASMISAGMNVTVTETVVRGKGVRSDITMGNIDGGYEIVTPSAGWRLDKMGGTGTVTAMTSEEVKSFQDQLNPEEEYYNYKEKGFKAEYLGKEDLKGTPCYKLKITGKSGIPKTVYFDWNSYYKVQETERVETPRGPMDVTTTFSEFKKFPEGIVVSMKAKNDYQEINITQVEINKTIDDSVFKPAKN